MTQEPITVEGSDAFPDYTKFIEYLYCVPATWLPALLIEVVKQCVRRSVFKPGGIERVVARVVNATDITSGMEDARS